jgi:hypothetical protein
VGGSWGGGGCSGQPGLLVWCMCNNRQTPTWGVVVGCGVATDEKTSQQRLRFRERHTNDVAGAETCECYHLRHARPWLCVLFIGCITHHVLAHTCVCCP